MHITILFLKWHVTKWRCCVFTPSSHKLIKTVDCLMHLQCFVSIAMSTGNGQSPLRSLPNLHLGPQCISLALSKHYYPQKAFSPLFLALSLPNLMLCSTFHILNGDQKVIVRWFHRAGMGPAAQFHHLGPELHKRDETMEKKQKWFTDKLVTLV